MKNSKKDILAKALTHHFAYHFYTQDEINCLKAVNLVDLCVYMFEEKLSYQNGALVIANRPHIVVHSEGFYDVNRKIKIDAVNGLRIYFGFDFPQTCYIIKSYYESDAIFDIENYVRQHYPLAYSTGLPLNSNLNDILQNNLLTRKGNNSLKMVFSVLHNRMGFDREVIAKFLHDKKLIVNKKFDLCFLEYVGNNIVTVTKKVQEKDHMAIEVDSVERNKTFTWSDADTQTHASVYVFEDIYEIMSYLSLAKMQLVPQPQESCLMLSLNGTSFHALNSYLRMHNEVQTIYACLSNTQHLADHLNEIAFDADRIINEQQILEEYAKEHEGVNTWHDMLVSAIKNRINK